VWHCSQLHAALVNIMLGFLPQQRIAGTDAKMSGI
jgi:hypothetical protein